MSDSKKKEVKKSMGKINEKTNSDEKKKQSSNTMSKKTTSQRKRGESKPVKKKKPEVNSKVLTVDKNKIALEKKYNRLVFVLLVSIIAIIFLVFLANKTFFRTQYVNNNFKMEIPLFTYFISDENNVITFKTLRKSENVKKYFDEYLSNLDNFDYYMCSDGKTLYYNEQNNIIIYNIEVKKNIAIKTIKVKYDIKRNGRVCA